MKTIGFIKSKKENEKRLALLPEHITSIKNTDAIYMEENYGVDLGIDDSEYKKMGCHIAKSISVLEKDIICDPKIGDAEYIQSLKNKTIFGWIHATQNKELTDILIENKITAYAWEEMFDAGRHVFWRNNEIAGETAIMHAIIEHGIMPYDANVAILGNGNTARGAYKILTQLGANITIYTRKMEDLFKREISQYDIVVNAILWDVHRKDHIIYKEDLLKMKKNAMIIDISCDKNGAIETSIPTTIQQPTYIINGIKHYVVDHTPSLAYKTVSKELSKQVSLFLDELVEEKENSIMRNANIIKSGKILDSNIIAFQNRK